MLGTPFFYLSIYRKTPIGVKKLLFICSLMLHNYAIARIFIQNAKSN